MTMGNNNLEPSPPKIDEDRLNNLEKQFIVYPVCAPCQLLRPSILKAVYIHSKKSFIPYHLFFIWSKEQHRKNNSSHALRKPDKETLRLDAIGSQWQMLAMPLECSQRQVCDWTYLQSFIEIPW